MKLYVWPIFAAEWINSVSATNSAGSEVLSDDTFENTEFQMQSQNTYSAKEIHLCITVENRKMSRWE